MWGHAALDDVQPIDFVSLLVNDENVVVVGLRKTFHAMMSGFDKACYKSLFFTTGPCCSSTSTRTWASF